MDVHTLLQRRERLGLLRFLTAGSVDDGKSTLIGRLMHDSKQVFADQLAAAQQASTYRGAGEVDFSLLLDGLKSEREQGITIDVAYRYFATPRRNFIIADCPGHEQYTRNMATGASTADLAIILIDARHGVLPQTRRHSFIASLLGIKHLVVVVNKMDLVDWSEDRYREIRADYADFAAKLELSDVHFLPVSALLGDNVVEAGGNMPWFRGEPLLAYLEDVHIGSDQNLIDLRFPVQYVSRPDATFRGYAGTVASGVLRVGDRVKALPSGLDSRVERLVTWDGDVSEARPGDAVTVVLADERDIARGDMLVHRNNLPHLDRHLEAMVVWMAEEPLRAGRRYVLKQTTRQVQTIVDEEVYRINVNTLHREDSEPLQMNDIGRVRLTAAQPLMHDPYARNRETGAFILIDRETNNTVGAGMIVDRGPQWPVRDETAAVLLQETTVEAVAGAAQTVWDDLEGASALDVSGAHPLGERFAGWTAMPADRLPPGRKWDLITAVHVLSDVDDPEATLATLAAHLAPGGFLLIADLFSAGEVELGIDYRQGEAEGHQGRLRVWPRRLLDDWAARQGGELERLTPAPPAVAALGLSWQPEIYRFRAPD